jgi:ABC-2 type transport system ATP-binding protein
MDKTILISSHILADLGEICNRIGIIEKGNLLVDGTMGDVLKMVKPSSVVFVKVDGDADFAVELMKRLPFVVQVGRQNGTINVQVEPGFNEVWKLSSALVEKGVRLNHIEQESESLERAFIQLTQGTVS